MKIESVMTKFSISLFNVSRKKLSTCVARRLGNLRIKLVKTFCSNVTTDTRIMQREDLILLHRILKATLPRPVSYWLTVRLLKLLLLFFLKFNLVLPVGMLSLENRGSFCLLQSDPSKPFNFLQNFKNIDTTAEYSSYLTRLRLHAN